jgi:hypothetical protein
MRLFLHNGLFLCLFGASLIGGEFLALAIPSERTPKPLEKHTKFKEVKEIGLDGVYKCNGTDSSGKQYSGIATIKRIKEVYIVHWIVGGTSSFSGFGIRHGDTFAVSWTTDGPKGSLRGINSYRIEADRKLIGKWATMPGTGILQKETLVFSHSLEEE